MAIFTKYGDEVVITAYHGKHSPPWNKKVSLMLVSVRGFGEPRYAFATELRADGGINEIEAAVDTAPEVGLSKREFAKAIKQAE